MPYAEFDTDVYFGIVADNLLRDHGQTALSLADQALKKMKDIGDDEGFMLWQGVQNQLMERVRDYHIPKSTTIH
jgi:hypothetical protein